MDEACDMEMRSSTLTQLLDYVYSHTGIKMDEKKKSLLQGRVRSRMNKLVLARFEDYLEYLESHGEEVQAFINAVTTNETSFFRTPRVWEYFNKDFLPRWFKENPGRTLKIWSAASSSGEEAHTIAILCQEYKSQHVAFQYQILGTDISTQVLERAEHGEYCGRSIENFRTKQPLLYTKYNLADQEVYRAHPDLKSHMKFMTHNLFKPLRSSDKFDIIFLRNVLIYFDAADQEKVLFNVSQSLQPSGILVIGESESLNSLKTTFKYVVPLIYQGCEA